MNPPRTHWKFTRVTALALLVISALLEHAFGQEASGELTYTRQTVFRIPFQTDPGERRLKQVQLYVSTDLGKSWHPYANVRPDESYFTFTANRDGVYWFTVRTVDTDNRAYPLTMESARPGLKVCVDTQPPVMTLRPLPPRENSCGVEWEIQEEFLDPASLGLEYRVQGAGEWLPLRLDPAMVGQHSWKPTTSGTLEVRLRARDRAGNDGEARTTVLANQESRLPPELAKSVIPPAAAASARMVNSKRISLNYEVKNVGPSGVSAVELWYTQDGRSWQKYSEDANNRPPYQVDVNDEGVYGFSLVVRSGVGLSDRPPQVGDAPQVWVEVDLRKPVVQILNIDVGRGAESGNLTVTWTASDKNLAKQPITLSYAEQATGPWTSIAANLENSGRHVWRMPSGVPYRFFVRVEAADKAGNLGAAETGKAIIVDLAQPKGVILNVEPSKN